VELWADVNASQCSLNDLVPVQVLNVHVFVDPNPSSGATGIQFAAPKPPCFTGYYLGDQAAPGVLTIGNSQTGVAVALGGCFASPALAMTIQYLGLGTTPECCQYPVVRDPSRTDIVVVDCNFVETASLGNSITFNEAEWCACGALVPVLVSSFDARATDAGVAIAWELAGDETAERFTLLRRTGESANGTPVDEGAVTGTRGSYLDKTVDPGTTYHYELLVRTRSGDEFRSPVVTVTTPQATLTLGQNHPNPFNPVTVIPYTLPNGSSAVRVRLSILDVSGRLVRTLVDEDQTGGAREVVWQGADDRGNPVSSGVYFYVLDVGKQRLTRKLVLLK
jgi:hypothetical protein